MRDDDELDDIIRRADHLDHIIDAAAVLSALAHHIGAATISLDPAGPDLDRFRAVVADIERLTRAYIDGTATACTR